MTVLRFLSIALLVPVAACGGGAEDATPPPSPARPPILVVVADATHAAHLGAYGDARGRTPALDALASGGAVFRRAFANANWTLPSTACLLTGRLQEEHGVVSKEQRLSSSQPLLSELLQGEGYRTAAFVEMAYAHPVFGFDRGFDDFTYFGPSVEGSDGTPAPRNPDGTAVSIVESAVDWMRAAAGEPWFVYVHGRRPHSPYNPAGTILRELDPDGPLADGSRDGALISADAFGYRTLPPAERERVETLYLANLMMVDRAIDAFADEVLAQGGYLVFTSDHGEALGLEGVFGHGIHLADDNVDVPLIVRGPDVVPGERRAPVCTVDLLPTVLELTGFGDLLDGLGPLPGRSYAPLLREPGPAPARGPLLLAGKHVLDVGLQVAAIEGDTKVVLERDGSTAWFERGDRGDLPIQRPAGGEALEARLRAWAERYADLRREGRVEGGVDAALQRDLEVLGYSEQ